MGYIRHHAIVVTDHSHGEFIEAARDAATRFGLSVSDIVMSPNNRYRSFLVAPDGSKEGWEESDKADTARASLISWLEDQRYDDGSSPLDWVEVRFGGDDRGASIISHTDGHSGDGAAEKENAS